MENNNVTIYTKDEVFGFMVYTLAFMLLIVVLRQNLSNKDKVEIAVIVTVAMILSVLDQLSSNNIKVLCDGNNTDI